MLSNVQEIIAEELLKAQKVEHWSNRSREDFIQIDPRLFLAALNYGLFEGRPVINAKRVSKPGYFHQIYFFGSKFVTATQIEIYDSNDFFIERRGD